MNGIEQTGAFAIAITKTTPNTGFTATTYLSGGETGFFTYIAGVGAGRITAAVTGQACHAFDGLAYFHSQQMRNLLFHRLTAHRAFAGVGTAFDQTLRKSAATGVAAGATIDVGQQFFHLIDARIFADSQLFVGHNDYCSQ